MSYGTFTVLVDKELGRSVIVKVILKCRQTIKNYKSGANIVSDEEGDKPLSQVDRERYDETIKISLREERPGVLPELHSISH